MNKLTSIIGCVFAIAFLIGLATTLTRSLMIGFKDVLISDDLSMKSLKGNLKENTIKTFSAGCNLALHCNGNLNEMKIVGNNSPLINPFLIKKTSQFYKILS